MCIEGSHQGAQKDTTTIPVLLLSWKDSTEVTSVIGDENGRHVESKCLVEASTTHGRLAQPTFVLSVVEWKHKMGKAKELGIFHVARRWSHPKVPHMLFL